MAGPPPNSRMDWQPVGKGIWISFTVPEWIVWENTDLYDHYWKIKTRLQTPIWPLHFNNMEEYDMWWCNYIPGEYI